jgi:predicted MPP superfamily phosphohydrolase
MALCAAAEASALATLGRASFLRNPRLQIDKRSRIEDLRRPAATFAGPGFRGLLARLPGNEMLTVELVERHLVVPGVALDGLSILHLTDLHLNGTPARAYFERVAELCNAWKPDLVALTGDVIDHPRVAGWIASTLGRLTAPRGCYFVLGNHDTESDPAATRALLTAAGWVDVAGRCIPLDVRGQPLAIAGTERPWMGVHPDASAAPPGAFRILLSHTPYHERWARRQGYHLFLAGHLHGGQINVPLLGSLKGDALASGLWYRPPTLTHVSRGLGEMLPFRWRCRPEVTKLVLRRT